jgi:nucleoside-diphosphate-sugar epimerase
MRDTLQSLVDHAGTGSRVRSLPVEPARAAMRLLASLGVAPFAPYHWLLYGESLWFDVTRVRTELDWEPKHSNASMVIESYEWFLAHRHELETQPRSHHQSPARPGLLRLLKRLP